MQLHLTFRGGICLPIAYRSILQGLIYHALEADPRFLLQLHEQGRVLGNHRFKGFTFSPLSGEYFISGKRIVFPEDASFEIRSIDSRVILLLSERLSKNSVVSLGSNSVVIADSRICDRHLLVPSADICLISPMVAYVTDEGGKTIYYGPSDPEYLSSVRRNALRKWESLHGSPEGGRLCIEKLGGMKSRKEATSFKHTYITAWYGEYRLQGEPELIDMLYQTGLGAKSSQGFGLFDAKWTSGS